MVSSVVNRSRTTRKNTSPKKPLASSPQRPLLPTNLRISGGVGALVPWLPIKAYRPCPSFTEAKYKYTRQGQSLNEVCTHVGKGETSKTMFCLQTLRGITSPLGAGFFCLLVGKPPVFPVLACNVGNFFRRWALAFSELLAVPQNPGKCIAASLSLAHVRANMVSSQLAVFALLG